MPGYRKMPARRTMSRPSLFGVPEMAVLGTLCTTLLLMLWPQVAPSLALVKGETLSLTGIFGIITHPFATFSLALWLLSSLMLLAAGWVMLDEVHMRRQVLLLLAGWATGSVIFMVSAAPGEALAGMGSIARAYLGAGAAYVGLKWWKLDILKQAAGLVFATIILLDLLVGFLSNLPLLLSAIVGALIMSQWLPARPNITLWSGLG